jgi:ATP-dependent RNA helicase DeaD
MILDGRVPHALARALAARGYLALTPVQRAVLAVEPQTRDMLVSAEAGSGKTIAFGLALAGRLLAPTGRAPAGGAPLAAVVTPTRELALQVAGELAWLYAGTGVRVVCCAGGMDMRAERARLAAGCELVVGSPGRLRDHVGRGWLDAAGLGCLVLDEADEMLDMGFRADLEFLLHAAPADRRTLMFSATLSRRIETLAGRFQTDAARIDATPGSAVAAHIRFEAVAVPPRERENAVAAILRRHGAERAIVFCGTRAGVEHLAVRLRERGFEVVTLSGALPQRERNAALASMRLAQGRVCVATDVAARGVDLPGLGLVIHADPPANERALTHRSGRTGRAGRKGLVVLVVPHPRRRRVETLARRAGIALCWVPAPEPGAPLGRAGEVAAEPPASP